MLEALPFFGQSAVGDLVGLSAVSIFLALFFATFVSEDAACIAAGALAASGDIGLALAVSSCFSGIVVGDLALYGVGRLFGRRVLMLGVARRFVSESSLARASSWLNRRGASAIFLSRFTTGLRLPTYLAAGLLRTDFRTFAFYFVVAAGIWTPLIVGSVALFGDLLGGRLSIAALALFFIARFATTLFRRRTRRLFVGRIRRITKWEFWPLAIFYFPVACYVLALAIRHRSLTAFTCANPAIPGGGFAGESKDAIYQMIARDPDNRDYLLRHCVVESRKSMPERMAAVRSFMDANTLDTPIVLKPDAGERGKGVQILATDEQLEEAIALIETDHIVQEFFEGDEISVFYMRYPNAPVGSIFSMTEKIFPVVIGDGASTLEELILDDSRAVCLAEKYFGANHDRLDYVPKAGEAVQLIHIGTHSRGAIFRDGMRLKTVELERAIDDICQRIDGFYFGRFDIRYSSLEDLQTGRGFKIIELNGVTSESTNIYDPRYSLADAYRILFRQWRIAFDIGAANRKRGFVPTGVIELLQPVFLSSRADAA